MHSEVDNKTNALKSQNVINEFFYFLDLCSKFW